MTKWKKPLLKNRKILAMFAISIILFGMFYSLSVTLSSIGYMSGTQGLDILFDSVRWNGGWWSATSSGPAPKDRYTKQPVPVYPSSRSFGFSMDLDPDWATGGMPDLCASTQTMTRSEDSPSATYVWSVDVGSPVTLANGTIVQKANQFEMYRFKMDWAVNILLSGTDWESVGKYEDYPDMYVMDTPNYAGAEIWIKLVPKSFIYFKDNPDAVYFAPCYIALKEPAQWVGIDNNNKVTLNDADISSRNDLIPKATGEATGIYYSRGGGETITDQTLLSYKGFQLDPQIFRKEYWTRINLLSFYPYWWQVWGGIGGYGYKFPSVYLHFQVDVFVVGQWTVYYKTGEVPNLTPHPPVTVYTWVDNLLSFLSSPVGQFWLIVMLIFIALIIITIFLPGFWNFLFVYFGQRKKGGGNG